MTSLNNPAGRLHALLNRGRTLGKSEPCLTAWANLFAIKNNPEELLRRIGRVLSLPNAARQAVLSLSNVDHELFLRWYPNVNAAFTKLQLDGPWSAFITRITDPDLLSLEHCSERLSLDRPEPVIDSEDLANLRAELEAALEEILEADVPDRLRSFMATHLRLALYALDEYSIWGAPPVREAFEAAFGAVIINQEIRIEHERSPAVRRFLNAIAAIAVLFKITASAVTIAERAPLLLKPPAAASEAQPNSKELDTPAVTRRV